MGTTCEAKRSSCEKHGLLFFVIFTFTIMKGVIYMKKYLFHGSNCGTITVLEPRISLEFKKHVYATDNFFYALVRAGKQLDLIREEYYGIDKPFELAECYPNAFKQQFNCKGYIYLLDPKDFYQDLVTLEYKSDEPVIPVDRIDIENIWDYIRKLGEYVYDLYWYDDEEYWWNVRGGREGFLKRKLERKEQLKNLLQAE